MKTGGASNVSTETGQTVSNYPALQVVTTFRGASLPNNETGLYEQVLRLSNPTSDAVRNRIANLPSGVQVFGSLGTLNGAPYVQYNRPITGGESVEVIIDQAFDRRMCGELQVSTDLPMRDQRKYEHPTIWA